MFNIFKKVKNKVNTSEKDYSLSYDNLAIPEIHKKDSGSKEDDPDISSDIVQDDITKGIIPLFINPQELLQYS